MRRRKISGLQKSVRKAKRTIHGIKLLKPVYRRRKHVAYILKSIGQAIENRL